MRIDPKNASKWRHKRSFHNRGAVWDTMAKWAGEEKDWVQEVTKKAPQMEEVIVALLK